MVKYHCRATDESFVLNVEASISVDDFFAQVAEQSGIAKRLLKVGSGTKGHTPVPKEPLATMASLGFSSDTLFVISEMPWKALNKELLFGDKLQGFELAEPGYVEQERVYKQAMARKVLGGKSGQRKQGLGFGSCPVAEEGSIAINLSLLDKQTDRPAEDGSYVPASRSAVAASPVSSIDDRRPPHGQRKDRDRRKDRDKRRSRSSSRSSSSGSRSRRRRRSRSRSRRRKRRTERDRDRDRNRTRQGRRTERGRDRKSPQRPTAAEIAQQHKAVVQLQAEDQRVARTSALKAKLTKRKSQGEKRKEKKHKGLDSLKARMAASLQASLSTVARDDDDFLLENRFNAKLRKRLAPLRDTIRPDRRSLLEDIADADAKAAYRAALNDSSLQSLQEIQHTVVQAQSSVWGSRPKVIDSGVGDAGASGGVADNDHFNAIFGKTSAPSSTHTPRTAVVPAEEVAPAESWREKVQRLRREREG